METIINKIHSTMSNLLYGRNKVANKSFLVFAIVSALFGLAALSGMIAIAIG